MIGVELISNDADILLAAREGKANRFKASTLRAMGRVSTGVRGMLLRGDNEVVGLIAMEPDSTNDVLVVSEKGYGKRTNLDAYRLSARGTMGVKTLNVTERTGQLVAFEAVNDENDLMIINRSGITLRLRVADVRVCGRATQGVRLINLDKRGEEIASVCAVPTDPDEQAQSIDGEELPELSEADLNEPDVDENVPADENLD